MFRIQLYGIVLLMGAASIILLGLSVYAWKRRMMPGAIGCSLTMLAGAHLVMGYALTLQSSTLESMIFYLRLGYIGVATVPVCWLILVLQLTLPIKQMNRTGYAALFLIPFVSLGLHMTNGLHHWFYRSLEFSKVGPYTIPVIIHGPGFWLMSTYSYAAMIAGTCLLTGPLFKSRGEERRRLAVLLIGAAIPWALNFLYLTGMTSFHADLSPVGILVTGLLYLYGIRRHQLFHLTPIEWKQAFDSMHDGVLILDMQGVVIHWNKMAVCILPLLEHAQVGRDRIKGLLRADQQDWLALWGQAAALHGSVPLHSIERLAGSFQLALHPVWGRGNRQLGWILTMRDVSEQLDLMATLDRLSRMDELTQIANRRCLFERGEAALMEARRSGSSYSFLLLDVDHFKLVNDRYGHSLGDLALQHLAHRLMESIEDTALLGRYGGEEFAVVLPGRTEEQAAACAERLRQYVEHQPLQAMEKRITLTVSIGIYGVNSVQNETLSDFLQGADCALYEAKRLGRNRVMRRSSVGTLSTNML